MKVLFNKIKSLFRHSKEPKHRHPENLRRKRREAANVVEANEYMTSLLGEE